VKSNSKWISQNLKQFGWQYVVVDMEWFVTNPIPEGNSKSFDYAIDAYGRYIPALLKECVRVRLTVSERT